MSHIHWDDSYSVNSGLLDDHHKLLFNLFNRYCDALHRREGIKALADLFAEVIEYADTHFRVEEILMQRSGYPFIKSHKQAHGFLLHRAQRLLARINSGDQVACDQAAEFIRNWLEKHIRGVDAQYAPYVAEQLIDDVAV